MIKELEKQGYEVKKLETPKTLIIDGWEYDTEDTQKNVSFKNIVMRKGWELWTSRDCENLHNNKVYRKEFNLDNCWFWIKQPFKFNEEKGLAARFSADDDGADLRCDGDPADSYSALGVRFKRKVKGEK